MENCIADSEINALLEQVKFDGIKKIIVGAIIVKNGEVLLLTRASTEDFLPDFVELPSGEVEEGETLIEALIREIKEETGLSIISVDRYLDSFDYSSRSGKKTRQFNFLVTVDEGEITLNPKEHQSFDWMNSDRLAREEINISSLSRVSVENALRKLHER